MISINRESLQLKWRVIYKPYLLISIAIIAIYSFLNWYYLIKPQSNSLSEETSGIWLPLLLPWIPLIIWIRPRLKILTFKKPGNKSFGLIILAAFSIWVATAFFQKYLITATGELTIIKYLNVLHDQKITKFYKIRNYTAEKEDRQTYYTSNVTGKYNSSLDLSIYVTCPIYEVVKVDVKDNDSGNITSQPNKNNSLPPDSTDNGIKASLLNSIKFTPPAPPAWLCIKYYKQISNRLSTEIEKSKEHSFYNTSINGFDAENFDSITYFSRTGYNKDRTGFIKAISKSNDQASASMPFLLEPHFNSYEDRNGNNFTLFLVSFLIGHLFFLIMILFARLNEEELSRWVTTP